MPGHPARPHVDATLLGQGSWSGALRRSDNRIRYARTTAELEKLVPYLELAHRAAVRHLNLTFYGVLLVLHVPIGGTISAGPVYWIHPDGMSVGLELFPPTCVRNCLAHRPYVLYTVRKASVRRPVKTLYIEEYVRDYPQTP